jgi:hypothetical protein
MTHHPDTLVESLLAGDEVVDQAVAKAEAALAAWQAFPAVVREGYPREARRLARRAAAALVELLEVARSHSGDTP